MSRINKMFDIINFIEKYNIKNYFINDDLTVDVNGNVSIEDKDLKEIPIQFRNINGRFSIYGESLLSLKGCPHKVNGDFDCSYCKSIVTLDGAPEYIEGCFLMMNLSYLKTLHGFPEHIGQAVYLNTSNFFLSDDNEYKEENIKILQNGNYKYLRTYGKNVGEKSYFVDVAINKDGTFSKIYYY